MVTVAGANLTFADEPVTIGVGSTSGTFQFTAPSSGSYNLSATHAGGNAGMSNPTIQAFTAQNSGPLLLPNNPQVCVLSPGNWYPGSGNEMCSISPGAYARFYIGGGAGAGVTLELDTASTGAFLYQIDDNQLSATSSSLVTSGSVTIPMPDNNAHTVTVLLSGYSGSQTLWTADLLGILGLQLPPGAAAGAAVQGENSILIYGSSIEAGFYAGWTQGAQIGSNDGENIYDYSYYLGQSFMQMGWEYSIVAVNSQGYTNPGEGGTPTASVAWSEINGSYSHLTAGKYTVQPTIIYISWMGNDAEHSTETVAQVQAAAVATWQGMRAAAPNALIVITHEVGIATFTANGSGVALPTAVQGAVTQYQEAFAAANGGQQDNRLVYFDLGPEFNSRFPSQTSHYTSGGQYVHPNMWGHANIAALLLPIIHKFYHDMVAPPFSFAFAS